MSKIVSEKLATCQCHFLFGGRGGSFQNTLRGMGIGDGEAKISRKKEMEEGEQIPLMSLLQRISSHSASHSTSQGSQLASTQHFLSQRPTPGSTNQRSTYLLPPMMMLIPTTTATATATARNITRSTPPPLVVGLA